MQPNQLPIWAQYVWVLAPTVVAVVVGLIAARIAYKQWRTAADRLRLDLYEKRLAVYDAIRSLLSTVTLQGQVTVEDLGKFHTGVRGAEFLFYGEAKAFVTTVGARAARAMAKRALLQRQPNHPRADQLIDEEEDLLEFLRSQSEHLDRIFAPYLDLSEIGIGVGFWSATITKAKRIFGLSP